MAVILPLVVLALGACGDDEDEPAAREQPTTTEAASEEGLPTRFTGEFYQTVDNESLPRGITIYPSADVMVVQSIMTSARGTGALISLSLTVPPPKQAEGGSASIECGGQSVNGPFVQEGPGGTGLLQIENQGAARLQIDSNRAVFPAADAAPLCTEHRGTWQGLFGPLEGKRGTFVTYGNHDDSKQIYEAFLTLTES